jgi:hypothetical protein
VKAEDDEEARAMALADPAVSSKMATFEIEPMLTAVVPA